jgi:hypothetical protein
MALPLFVVSTADSEGVLGVLTIDTYYFYGISQARNWVSIDSGTDFRNYFGNKQSKYY